MATTNLNSKTLGEILVQSGTGVPDHVAPRGSMYTNVSTGTLYLNADGSTGWDSLNRVSYVDIYIQANATVTTMASNTTWFPLTGLTWTTASSNGFTVASTGVVTCATGRAGRYNVIATGTLAYSTATAVVELGVSKNGANPASGYYQGATLTSVVATQSVTVTDYIDLVAGDTVQVVMRIPAGSTAANATYKHGGLTLIRIGD
jgi:hypothetical protein